MFALMKVSWPQRIVLTWAICADCTSRSGTTLHVSNKIWPLYLYNSSSYLWMQFKARTKQKLSRETIHQLAPNGNAKRTTGSAVSDTTNKHRFSTYLLPGLEHIQLAHRGTVVPTGLDSWFCVQHLSSPSAFNWWQYNGNHTQIKGRLGVRRSRVRA